MGGASALLGRRGAAFAALAAAVVAYYLLVDRLWTMSTWWNIAWLDLLVMPAVLGLVWLALPAWRAHLSLLAAAAVGTGALAALFEHEALHVPANFAKLAATAFFAWLFLAFFEELGWVVLVACVIPFVDAYSVWRGPTNNIIHHRRQVFTTLSVAFPVPGGHQAANLGLPDLLFFALFLGAAVRFRLRPGPTWLAMTASFGATMALSVAFDTGGLPALPLLSVGFLAANGDLVWRRLRSRPRA